MTASSLLQIQPRSSARDLGGSCIPECVLALALGAAQFSGRLVGRQHGTRTCPCLEGYVQWQPATRRKAAFFFLFLFSFSTSAIRAMFLTEHKGSSFSLFKATLLQESIINAISLQFQSNQMILTSIYLFSIPLSMTLFSQMLKIQFYMWFLQFIYSASCPRLIRLRSPEMAFYSAESGIWHHSNEGDCIPGKLWDIAPNKGKDRDSYGTLRDNGVQAKLK